ncbi:MAG: helical backbone metal receptor [Oligosphaeraceae bacterium]
MFAAASPSRALLALVLLLLAAPLRGEPPAETTPRESAAGGIVSLSPALTELAYFLGGGERMAGRSSACDAPPQALSLPVMGDFALPSLEKILAAHPRAVVSNDLVNPAIAKALEAQGIGVEIFPCRNVEEYLAMVERMGELLSRPREAQRERQRILDFLESLKKNPPAPRRAMALIWEHPPMVAGEGTFCHELLRLAGSTMDFQGRQGYFTPGAEWLLSCQLDCLWVFHQETLDAPGGILEALKGKMRLFPQEDLLFRPGPRWTEGVTLLRELMP